mmetsp:Transcript_9901/g.30406  ORF Transcript_9901/g.30406 Transcript_9901/m.30406 type:complete len:214 (-) Transcript_9901:46-687(-)
MGLSSFVQHALGLDRKPVRIMMLGLDAAGKTTALYRLKLGEVRTEVPTIGFHVEMLDARQASVTSWDVGGRDKIRPLWRYFFQDKEALVFVVDSSDHERMDDTREELQKILDFEELRTAPLLVLANKQDLPNALPVPELTERLQLHQLRGRKWFIQPCCLLEGQGLWEGMDWLDGAVKQAREADGSSQQDGPAEKAAAWGRQLASPKFWLSLL